MTETTQLQPTSRERFLEAARKELAAFEKRESEFRKLLRKERAEELRIPIVKDPLRN